MLVNVCPTQLLPLAFTALKITWLVKLMYPCAAPNACANLPKSPEPRYVLAELVMEPVYPALPTVIATLLGTLSPKAGQ